MKTGSPISSSQRCSHDGPAECCRPQRDRSTVLVREETHLRMINPAGGAIRRRYRAAANHLAAGLSAAQMAAEGGYADQPHLHRDVQSFTGATPSAVAGAPWSSWVTLICRRFPVPAGRSGVTVLEDGVAQPCRVGALPCCLEHRGRDVQAEREASRRHARPRWPGSLHRCRAARRRCGR
jgi:hypothetical protein